MKSNDPENSKLFATGASLSDSRAWIFSLSRQLGELLREMWTPSPGIVITAVPVEVGEIWSKKQNHLQMGDPNGVIGPPSGGKGTNYGIGEGDDHGVGNRNGPSAGSGDRPGGPGGIVNIGVGGASPPACPIPASEPNYTDDARKARVRGAVVMNVIVNKDGSVSVLDVTQKLGYGLDAEASQFVAKSFRCKPGIYQGQPVATPVRIVVNFHLY